ncbi:MAG TPA: nucleotidyltransferase domain-containing protein [Candidatus Thermoplasmatota archaeon]
MVTEVSIRPETWLESVFATSLQVRLLRLLHRDPKKFWTEREAARAIEAPAPSARKVFRRLEALGLLEVRQAGRAHLVRPRQDLGITKEIQRAFTREASMVGEIWAAVRDACPVNVSCYLFGSTARGTAQRGSDIDLLVTGRDKKATRTAADEVRRAIRSYAPIPINVVALSHRELRLARFGALVANIRRDGRRLAGPEIPQVAA